MAEDGFLSRWSRRKAQAARGPALAEPAPETPSAPAAAPPVSIPVPTARPAELTPAPTLDDVARIDGASDFSRFVARGVAPAVRRAALRKLFADPRFNLIDGLDIYMADYNRPDPIPPDMLRQLAQSKLLRLFDDDDVAPDAAPAAAQAPAAPPPPTLTAPDENADLQLQPQHAAGRRGPGAGPAAG